MCKSSYFNRWKFSDSPERWSIKHTINFSKGLHSIIVLYYWHPWWEITASCCNSAFLCSAVQRTPALLHHCAAFHNVQLLVSPDSAFPSCRMQCFSGSCPGSQEQCKQHKSPHSCLNSQPLQHHEGICSHAWLAGAETSGRTALSHWAGDGELLPGEHLAVGVSKSTLDSQPALSAHQTFSCSMKFDFQRRWKIFVTELLQCCQFNYITLQRDYNFPLRSSMWIPKLRKGLLQFPLFWNQHGHYCFGLSHNFHPAWNLIHIIWLLVSIKRLLSYYFSLDSQDLKF